VSNRKVFAVAVLVALAWAVAPVTEAQPPIRIGASLATTRSPPPRSTSTFLPEEVRRASKW
jgi:hypothetical protein